MVADSNFIYFATASGMQKMDWEDGFLTTLSNKEFQKIKLKENSIVGMDGSLWILKEGTEEKHIISNIQDFDICGSYIWSSQGDQAALLDTATAQVWQYDQDDGIPGKKIYGTNCDEDWVLFLTNHGVAFYNWERYHYEK
jgi:hypothetical protein